MGNSERDLPDADECREQSDVGKIHFDSVTSIWYECVFDQRHNLVTWTALPPDDCPN